MLQKVTRAEFTCAAVNLFFKESIQDSELGTDTKITFSTVLVSNNFNLIF